jgi:hypothetical protein
MVAMILVRIVSLVFFPASLGKLILIINVGVHRFIDRCEKIENKGIIKDIEKEIEKNPPADVIDAKAYRNREKNKRFRVEFVTPGGVVIWTCVVKEHCRSCAINAATIQAIDKRVKMNILTVSVQTKDITLEGPQNASV